MKIIKPYVLFLGNSDDYLSIKVALGIKYWDPTSVIGQITLPGCKVDLDLNNLDVKESVKNGAKTLIIGIANRGGVI